MNSVSSTGSSLRATSIASSTGNFGQNSPSLSQNTLGQNNLGQNALSQNLNSGPTLNPGSLTLAPLLAQPHTTTFHSRSGSTPENQAHRVSNSLRNNSNSPKNIKISSLSQSSLLDTNQGFSDSVFHSPIPGTAIEFKTHHQTDSVVSQKSNFSQKSNTSLKSSCGSGSNTGNRLSVGLEVVPEMGGKNSKFDKNSKCDQKLGFLSKNDSMSKIGSSSNNTTRSIENIANAPVHRRKLNTSGSMRRSNDGESSGVSSMMPRSASISNFRQENNKYTGSPGGKLEFSNSSGGVQTNTVSMMSSKKSSATSSSTNSLSNVNRVSSMPKLSRTDSFPRRQPSNKLGNNNNNFDGKINFDNMQPPDEHSRISGVITALPASSSYYNISASKARLLNNKNDKIDKIENKLDNKSSILDKNSIKSTSKIQENSASNTTFSTQNSKNTPKSIDPLKPLQNSQVTNRPNTMLHASPIKVQKQTSSSTPASPTSSTSSTLNESLSATIKQSIQNANDLSTKAAQYESKSSEKLSLIKNIQRRIKEFNMYKQEIEEDMQENNELGDEIKRRIHEVSLVEN